MSTLRPITHSVKKVTSKVCEKKFISLGRVLEYWGDVMGEEMAEYTEPVAIRVRKQGRGKNQYYNKTLHIAVPSAYSTTIAYRKGLILERINRLLPRENISDLLFVESSKPIKKPLKNKARELDKSEKDYLSSIVNDIEDDEIKERLLSMGQSFLKKDN